MGCILKAEATGHLLNRQRTARQQRLGLRCRFFRNPLLDRLARLALDHRAEIAGIEILRLGIVLHLVEAIALPRPKLTKMGFEVALEGEGDRILSSVTP